MDRIGMEGAFMSSTERPALADGGAPSGQHAAESLSHCLARCASATEARGLTFVDAAGRTTSWTYARFERQVRAIARGLRARGVAPGDRVLVRLADPEAFTLAVWACLVGGYVVVPLSAEGPLPVDARGAEAVAGLQQLLGPRLVIASEDDLAGLARLQSQFRLTIPGGLSGAELAGAWPDTSHGLDAEPSLDAVRIIFPTSGSTGAPRPVTQTGRALLAMCAGSTQMNAFSANDVFFNWMPMEHVGSVVFLGILPVFAGASQIHVANRALRADATAWLDQLSRFGASVSWAPNHVFNAAVKALQASERRRWDLGRLRFLVNAGESISPYFVQAFAELLVPYGLRRDAVRPAFGMSETCSGITWAEGLRFAGGHVCLGAPIPGASVRIVDADGALRREGDIGRLQVAGPSVTRAYFGLKRDAAFADDGWFDTGDQGFLRGGELYLTDREGEGIEIDGLTLHAHELETDVERTPGVLGGHVAVCRSSAQHGAEVLVFFCAEPGAAPDAIAHRIQAALGSRLGGRAHRLFALEPAEVPRTSIGKIQRRQLRQRAESGKLRPVASLVREVEG
jgi:microcystin synthetase protein McyG